MFRGAADARPAAAGADAEFNRAATALGLAVGLVVLSALFMGVGGADHDLAAVFTSLAQGRAPQVLPREGYLLEPVLPNLVGSALALAGLHGSTLLLTWWALGVGLFGSALVFALRNGLGLAGCLGLLCITRLTDLSTLWIGKPDPYTLAFLTVAVFARTRPLAAAAAFAAALCHPQAAVVGVLGAMLAQAVLGRRVRLELLPAALAGAGLDAVAYHTFYGDVPDRAAFVRLCAPDILRQGFGYWSLTSVGAIAAPALLIAALSPELVQGARARPLVAFVMLLFMAAVAVISSVLVYDHSRVAILLSYPMFLVFAASIRKPEPGQVAMFAVVLCAALAYRLVTPHVTQTGLRFQHWGKLARVLRVETLPPAAMDQPLCPLLTSK